MTDTTPGNGRTVLIITSGHVLSHVARCLMVARALRERGDHVIFAGGGHYLEIPSQDGFEVQSLYEVDVAGFLSAVGRQFAGAARLFNEERVGCMVEDELRLYREVKPDLVLYDFRALASTSAQLAGIPHVAVVNAYLTRYSTTWGRLPLHGRLLLAPLHRYLNVRPVNRVRRRYSLPPISGWDRRYHSDLVLMPDVPEYAPTRNLPAHMHYIGPLVWEPVGELPDTLNRINPDQRVLYFTMGSTGLPNLLKGVVEQLKGTDHYVVVSTGNQAAPADLEPLPDNFYATRYLPGSQMTRRCDVVVCHGGNTTVYQTLTAGVPVVAIPTHMDQRLNGELLVNAGAGVTLKLEEIGQVRQAVKNVLTTPSYKENAVHLQKILAGYDGPQTAARLIDQYLAKRERVVAPARELAPRIFPAPKRWATRLAGLAAGFVKRGELSVEDEAAIRSKMADSDG